MNYICNDVFQIRPHSELLGVRISTFGCGFLKDTMPPMTPADIIATSRLLVPTCKVYLAPVTFQWEVADFWLHTFSLLLIPWAQATRSEGVGGWKFTSGGSPEVARMVTGKGRCALSLSQPRHASFSHSQRKPGACCCSVRSQGVKRKRLFGEGQVTSWVWGR